MAKLGKTINNVIRGDTRTINCVFREADGVTPIPLASGIVRFTVNSSSDPASDSSAAITKVEDTTFTNPSEGEHTFTLSPADTTIDPGLYWYDSQFEDQEGNVLSAYRGKFIVQSDVTRS